MKPDFFRRLGLYVQPGFFDEETCATLRHEVERAELLEATVRRLDGSTVVDEGKRKTRLAEVPVATSEAVEAMLQRERPRLAEHFQLELTACEPPQFLVYRAGDFYGAHVDWSISSFRRRRVSIVAFINGESQRLEEGGYSGGSLVFHGHLPNSDDTSMAFPLTGEAGLLVGFRSDRLHEVSPVTDGRRYTVAAWFV